MISEQLKETITHNSKFVTYSLIITMLEKCINLLMKYGTSSKALSFLVVGLELISMENKEAFQYVREKEEIEKLIKDLEKEK